MTESNSTLAKERRARIALWLLGMSALLLAFTPLAKLLVYGFPCLALGLASYYVMNHYREQYIQLAVWLYLLTPLLHRIVDSRLGSSETPIMTAPYLVSAVALIPLLMNLRRTVDSYILPFICVFAAITYGALITMVHAPVAVAVKGSVAWILPLVGCGYVYSQRDRVEEMFDAFVGATALGTLVVGVYGLVQYFRLPEWDRVWMEATELAAFGAPAPFEVRVFSTMNAPQIAGAFLAIGIIVTYWSRFRFKYISMAAGICSLALTISRAAWVAFVGGFLLLLIRLPAKERGKIILAGGLAVVVLLAGLAIPAVNDTLSPRFQSLTDVKNDDSANERAAIYSGVINSLQRTPFGLGIGVENDGSGGDMSDAEHDSTAINLLLSFGVLGTVVFCSATAILLWRVASYVPITKGPVQALPAVVVALLAESLLNNIITGPIAFLLWMIIGFGCAFDSTQKAKTVGGALGFYGAESGRLPT